MTAVVEIYDLRKRYGEILAVDGVSLTVEEGEAFGYLGPNGSGKTTTIRCLLGLVSPTAGELRVLEKRVDDDLQGILAGVGYLPGEFGLWPAMTGGEVLDYLGDLSQGDLRRQVRFYSRGMKQKVGIIQAFQHDPHLVILDEPTEGLDPVMKDRFLSLLQEHTAAGGTLFLSSHILSEVELATDRVSILRKGKMVRVGPTRDLTGERVRHCTLTLRAPAREGALNLPGVTGLHGEDGRYRFDFRGEMKELIRALARLDVEEFLAEPETLTEAFFDVYEEET